VLDVEADRNRHALEAIAADDRITQRALASRLGIALGLANIYLKRLVRKGYVKCVHLQSNRLRYLLTPKGISEKTRLTYEFMEYSLVLYREVRRHLHTVLAPCVVNNRRRIAVYGTGEAAELAYLSITELGLQLVGVFDTVPGRQFLGHPVLNVQEHAEVEFDLLLVTALDQSEPIVQHLLHLGVAPDRVVALRQ
jgi:DNA-binding MarR family transcriptional regulator